MKRKSPGSDPFGAETTASEDNDDDAPISPPPLKRVHVERTSANAMPTVIRSPFQLTSVRDLPSSRNQDCVSLHDLLGDPLIREAWLFDFLFDVDFIMSHFDADVRAAVDVKLVHGSWKREDTNRIRIEDGIKRWPNVKSVTAYLRDPFGTHHSKMMVLFRHDDTAQLIVHTANMIAQDWTNFTQAVWQSPRLPTLASTTSGTAADQSAASELGTGLRFKQDLLRYCAAYGATRTGALSEQLAQYDFSAIKAAFIASAPSNANTREPNPRQTAWGWPGLQQALRQAANASTSTSTSQKPLIVAQVSSVGTLSADWIAHMQSVLATTPQRPTRAAPPDFRLIFPTDDEVRRSLDGYAAGASIHLRTQSARQQATLANLRPHLAHWAGDALDAAAPGSLPTPPRHAGRRRAAPHIKTYMRFASAGMAEIEWALLTSANLSAQAWGRLARSGEVAVASYEAGVLVWPALFGDADREVRMVPTFQTDAPDAPVRGEGVDVRVGLRMPYDVPLVRYSAADMPWVATARHTEPDWTGAVWPGSEPT